MRTTPIFVVVFQQTEQKERAIMPVCCWRQAGENEKWVWKVTIKVYINQLDIGNTQEHWTDMYHLSWSVMVGFVQVDDQYCLNLYVTY